MYENTPGSRDAAILVTQRGIHLDHQGGWQFLPSVSIVGVTVPPVPKEEITDLVLMHGGDRRTVLPVRGRRGRFPDVWVLYRFVNRTAAALRRAQPRAATNPARPSTYMEP